MSSSDEDSFVFEEQLSIPQQQFRTLVQLHGKACLSYSSQSLKSTVTFDLAPWRVRLMEALRSWECFFFFFPEALSMTSS